MIVRLHNLSARGPVMADALSVAMLMRTCDRIEAGIEKANDEDVRKSWQAPLFDLCKDAWIIESKCGQIVGYADVRHGSEVSISGFVMNIDVHPDYRGRGIGTLLLWLVEERARQLMTRLPADERVTLQISISRKNFQARELLEHERYNLVRQFWRVIIDMEEVSTRSMAASLPGGQLKLDLTIIDKPLQENADVPCNEIYTAQQYEVYEKVLRAGNPQVVETVQDMQCASV